jgi:hypothetical protein
LYNSLCEKKKERNKMSEKEKYYVEFLNDFEEWTNEQINVFKMAAQTAENTLKEQPENMDAAAAIVTYNSRVDAYQYLLTKFENLAKGKGFHELPDGFFEQNRKEY